MKYERSLMIGAVGSCPSQAVKLELATIIDQFFQEGL